MAEKKAEEVKVEEPETKVEPKVETPEIVVPTEKSEAYKELEATIEKYKTQNPAKYEVKKDALAKQLSDLA